MNCLVTRNWVFFIVCFFPLVSRLFFQNSSLDKLLKYMFIICFFFTITVLSWTFQTTSTPFIVKVVFCQHPLVFTLLTVLWALITECRLRHLNWGVLPKRHTTFMRGPSRFFWFRLIAFLLRTLQFRMFGKRYFFCFLTNEIKPQFGLKQPMILKNAYIFEIGKRNVIKLVDPVKLVVLLLSLLHFLPSADAIGFGRLITHFDWRRSLLLLRSLPLQLKLNLILLRAGIIGSGCRLLFTYKTLAHLLKSIAKHLQSFFQLLQIAMNLG